jgi:hypothetical protein
MRARALLLHMQRICSKTRPPPVGQAAVRRDTFAVPSISPLPNREIISTYCSISLFLIDAIAVKTAK